MLRPAPDPLLLFARIAYPNLCYNNFMWKKQTNLQLRAQLKKAVERNQLLVAIVQAGGCQRCNFDDVRALDFHHRDPTKKKFHVSLAVKQGMALERLKEEMAKCDVLCANCHRMVESENRSGKIPPRPWESAPRLRFEGIPQELKISARAKKRDEETHFTDPITREFLWRQFKRCVEEQEDCWIWKSLCHDNHPRMLVFDKLRSASAVALAFTTGTLAWHCRTKTTCGNPLCVRPEHVEPRAPVTMAWGEINKTLNSRAEAINLALQDEEQRATLRRRFDKFVEVEESGHWAWVGGRIRDFPHFTLYGEPILAKRIALGLRSGHLPRKVKEICGIKHCMNPEHLEERSR